MSVRALVTAPVVAATQDDGKVAYFYRGAVVFGTSAAEVDRLLALGMVDVIDVVEVDDVTVPELQGVQLPDPDADSVGQVLSVKPPRVAPKSDWVDFAVSRGATRIDAEKASKDDLIGAYGA